LYRTELSLGHVAAAQKGQWEHKEKKKTQKTSDQMGENLNLN